MSVQAVRDFWQKTRQDAALHQQIKSAMTGNKAATLAAMVRIGASAGFVFTVEEHEIATNDEQKRRYQAGELSEQQLAELSGGAAACTAGSCRPS